MAAFLLHRGTSIVEADAREREFVRSRIVLQDHYASLWQERPPLKHLPPGTGLVMTQPLCFPRVHSKKDAFLKETERVKNIMAFTLTIVVV